MTKLNRLFLTLSLIVLSTTAFAQPASIISARERFIAERNSFKRNGGSDYNLRALNEEVYQACKYAISNNQEPAFAYAAIASQLAQFFDCYGDDKRNSIAYDFLSKTTLSSYRSVIVGRLPAPKELAGVQYRDITITAAEYKEYYGYTNLIAGKAYEEKESNEEAKIFFYRRANESGQFTGTDGMNIKLSIASYEYKNGDKDGIATILADIFANTDGKVRRSESYMKAIKALETQIKDKPSLGYETLDASGGLADLASTWYLESDDCPNAIDRKKLTAKIRHDDISTYMAAFSLAKDKCKSTSEAMAIADYLRTKQLDNLNYSNATILAEFYRDNDKKSEAKELEKQAKKGGTSTVTPGKKPSPYAPTPKPPRDRHWGMSVGTYPINYLYGAYPVALDFYSSRSSYSSPLHYEVRFQKFDQFVTKEYPFIGESDYVDFMPSTGINLGLGIKKRTREMFINWGYILSTRFITNEYDPFSVDIQTRPVEDENPTNIVSGVILAPKMTSLNLYAGFTMNLSLGKYVSLEYYYQLGAGFSRFEDGSIPEYDWTAFQLSNPFMDKRVGDKTAYVKTNGLRIWINILRPKYGSSY